MNERTYEYHYIPPCIFRAWADSRGYVSFFFNKGDGEVHEAPYSLMYYEDIIPECPKREFEKSDIFLNKEAVDIVGRIVSGEITSLSRDMTIVYRLIIQHFYASPNAGGRRAMIQIDNARLVETMSLEERQTFTGLFMREERSTGDVLFARKYSDYVLPYILDLKPLIIDAPEGENFVMGPVPILLGNMYDVSMALDSHLPYGYDATVIIMPFSPKKAVALYDDKKIEAVAESDGRAVFSHEDMEKLNSYIVKSGSSTVFVEEGKYDADYYRSLRDIPFSMDVDYSIFSLRNPGDKTFFWSREFFDVMSAFDRKHYHSKGKAPTTEASLRKRIEYALSVLNGETEEE